MPDSSLSEAAIQEALERAAQPWIEAGRTIPLIFALAARIDPAGDARELAAEYGAGLARLWLAGIADRLEALRSAASPDDAAEFLNELQWAAEPDVRTLKWVDEAALRQAMDAAPAIVEAWRNAAGG